MFFSGDTSASHMSTLRNVDASHSLGDVNSGSSNSNCITKIAVLIQSTDDYVHHPELRLCGNADTNVQQLETLGYTVVSINPTVWQRMMEEATGGERSLFLKQQMGVTKMGPGEEVKELMKKLNEKEK